MTAVLSVLLTLASLFLQVRIYTTHRRPTRAEERESNRMETEPSA